MPYCSQCGVSLEKSETHCPLCGYKVPEDLVKPTAERAYPEGQNASVERNHRIRNKIFYTYFMIAAAATMILIVLMNIIKPEHHYFTYAIIIIIASVLYVFFLLGYIKKASIVLGCMGILTSFICLFLDSTDNVLSWSIKYALPMIVPATLIFMAFAMLYRKSKHIRHFIFIPVYICVSLAIEIPIIEIVINYNLYQRFHLSWSLITAISLLAFSGIITGLYYRLPEYIKERLIRIFHI